MDMFLKSYVKEKYMMIHGNRQFITIIMAAGCAGWGEDGPYKPDAEGDDGGEARAQEEATNASDRNYEAKETPTINDGGEEEREEQERVKEDVRDAVTDESESEPLTGGEDGITDETSSTGMVTHLTPSLTRMLMSLRPIP